MNLLDFNDFRSFKIFAVSFHKIFILNINSDLLFLNLKLLSKFSIFKYCQYYILFKLIFGHIFNLNKNYGIILKLY